MKRRQFIQSGSLMSLPIMLGGLDVTAVSRASLFNMFNVNDERVLVLVQMLGGNDGLNMIIPLDQYSGLSQTRPNILLPENSIIALEDKTGIHPSMEALARLYEQEKLAVIQSVGYPDQNRSHFRSRDIWYSGSESDEYLSTGWLGRYLDLNYAGFPDNYPNTEYPDPFAVTLSSVVSETCQGTVANFSYTLANENSVQIVEETVAAPPDGSCYGEELSFIRNTIQQSNAYASRVKEAFEKGNNIAEYQDTSLSNQLKIVANLISGGLKSKIYVVTIGGFDTHANQVLIGDTLNGEHAVLLKDVSDSIASFVQDCEALGIQERVAGMTFSEFGRQIIANNSFGTDHGTAAPLIVFGSCINQGVFGENPQIGGLDSIAPQEGVPMQFDFRSVYASLLVDWLGAKESDIRELLFEDFQKIPFVKNCTVSSVDEEANNTLDAMVTPNPARDYTYLNFVNNGSHVHISLFNAIGSQLDVLTNKSLGKGAHEIFVNMQSYASGSYFIRIAVDNKVKTVKFIKV